MAAPPPAWRGLRIGLLTHGAARAADGRTTAATLAGLPGLRIRRLFVPEHGFGAGAPGGALVHLDASRGPARAEWEGLDALVVDLQDAGGRTFTYARTLEHCLASAARVRKPVWVLDRPNPLGGRCEGPWPPTPGGLAGGLPVPLLHGLTLGELARLTAAAGRLPVALEVIRAEGWRRTMTHRPTGLAWWPPSPALTTFETAQRYAGLCLFEATNVRCRLPGRAFAFLGAPWADGPRIAAAANAAGLPGVAFRAGRHGGMAGVSVLVTAEGAYRPLDTALVALTAFARTHPGAFRLDARMMEALSGSGELGEALRRGGDPATLAARWRRAGGAFRAQARTVCLYPD